MAEDLIRYDLLVQDALRGVVRRVLTDAAREGLSGEHHFYVSFRTEAPGVRMSQRLREKYPQDMTIVLQHQFWDLGVTEHAFEVGLSFSGVPERLLIPFDALSGFFDPSVQFGLKFDLQEEGSGEAADGGQDVARGPRAVPRGAASEPGEVKPRVPGLAAISGPPKVVPALAPARAEEAGGPKAAKGGAKAPRAVKDEGKAGDAKSNEAKSGEGKAGQEKSAPDEKARDGAKDGAEVVSLDSFRRKN